MMTSPNNIGYLKDLLQLDDWYELVVSYADIKKYNKSLFNAMIILN